MIVVVYTTAKCLVYMYHAVLRCLAFLFIWFVCASLYGRLARAAAVSGVTQRRIQLAVHTALACRRSFIAHAGLVKLYYRWISIRT